MYRKSPKKRSKRWILSSSIFGSAGQVGTLARILWLVWHLMLLFPLCQVNTGIANWSSALGSVFMSPLIISQKHVPQKDGSVVSLSSLPLRAQVNNDCFSCMKTWRMEVWISCHRQTWLSALCPKRPSNLQQIDNRRQWFKDKTDFKPWNQTSSGSVLKEVKLLPLGMQILSESSRKQWLPWLF